MATCDIYKVYIMYYMCPAGLYLAFIMGASAPMSGTQAIVLIHQLCFHFLHQPVQTISGGGGGLGVATGALVAGALVGAAIEDSRERHHHRRPHVDVVVRYKAQCKHFRISLNIRHVIQPSMSVHLVGAREVRYH